MTKLKTARDGLNRRVEDGCRVLWCKAIKESTHGAGTLTDHYKNLQQKLQEVETYAIGDTADRCETASDRVMASTHIITSTDLGRHQPTDKTTGPMLALNAMPCRECQTLLLEKII
jgi:hypothetical protein